MLTIYFVENFSVKIIVLSNFDINVNFYKNKKKIFNQYKCDFIIIRYYNLFCFINSNYLNEFRKTKLLVNWININDILILKKYRKLKKILFYMNGILYYKYSNYNSFFEKLKITKHNKNINSTTFVCIIKNVKYFVKLVDKPVGLQEIRGYLLVNKYFTTTKLKKIMYLNKQIALFFLYENVDQNLLYKYFYNNNTVNENIENNIVNFIDKMIPFTIYSYKSNNDNLFKFRINRLTNWYKYYKLFDYNIVINGLKCQNTRLILNDCQNYFKEKILRKCYLSLGDIHELNMCCDNKVFDFNMAGYNSIVSDASVFFWSLIGGYYFMRKYHPWFKSSIDAEDYSCQESINFYIDNINKVINIKTKSYAKTLRLSLLNKLINKFKQLQLDNEFNSSLKYYLIMRILTPHNMTNMTMLEQVTCIYYMQLIYNNIGSNDSLSDLQTLFCKFTI